MSSISEVRARAKSLGISAWQKGIPQLEQEIAIKEAEIAASSASAPVKKGRPSWKWRNRFDVSNKDPNFRYRFVEATPERLERATEEGWSFVNKETGLPGEHNYDTDLADAKKVPGAKYVRGMVLMALPEDLAQDRDAFIREQTEAQTADISSRLRNDLAMSDDGKRARHQAEVTGNITIIR